MTASITIMSLMCWRIMEKTTSWALSWPWITANSPLGLATEMSLRIITKSIWDNPGNRGHRVRKSFAALWWQAQKHTVARCRRMRLANQVWFMAHPDCVVSSALIYADWPEYHELMFLREHLQQA